MIKNYHKIPENLIEKEDVDNFKEIDYDKQYVFWTNFDMVQTEIILLSKLELLDNSKTAAITLFNEYFNSLNNLGNKEFIAKVDKNEKLAIEIINFVFLTADEKQMKGFTRTLEIYLKSINRILSKRQVK